MLRTDDAPTEFEELGEQSSSTAEESKHGVHPGALLHPGQTQEANGMNPNNRAEERRSPLGADNNACPNDAARNLFRQASPTRPGLSPIGAANDGPEQRRLRGGADTRALDRFHSDSRLPTPSCLVRCALGTIPSGQGRKEEKKKVSGDIYV